ncbi:RDD family protein [Chitinimonas sp. JJ19]|uniref:RDD family protein n=1 Tax=Chitinimonas sp. JJ19 TaxID=3109352 RepID=UPI001A473DEC|nr:RDD family protein [Chitinimonas sp.]
MSNPYQPSSVIPEPVETGLEYVGFGARVLASIIDTLLTMCVTVPIMLLYMGDAYWDDQRYINGSVGFLVEWLLPAAAVIAFWLARQATPGKMAIGAKVVDATTGLPLKPGQAILRYLGYFVSTIPLFLGLLWVAFDARKQGWHDKIANTVVVRGKWPGKP